jgi:acyl-CoA thioesterase-1
MNATVSGRYSPFLKAVGAVIGMVVLVVSAANGQRIVFLGDSLTAGYGLDPAFAYPALVERTAGERGLSVTVVNAGLSGDTSAGGRRRVDWILREPADILFVALGGNDALRGLPPKETRANLLSIILRARERVPGIRVILAGMLAPPNMGETYQREFAAVYAEVAEQVGVELMPFLLDEVAGRPELNLPDAIHPNANGQEIIARNVWKVLDF